MYVVVQSLSHIWLCVSDCSPPGSSVHGLSQARILEWVGISFSRGSSWSRDRTQVSCIGKWILYYWATKEAHTYIYIYIHTYSFSYSFPLWCIKFNSVAQSCLTLCQASLSITNSLSPPKPMSIESVMPYNHLILCHPLLLLPSIFPSQGLFQWIITGHWI